MHNRALSLLLCQGMGQARQAATQQNQAQAQGGTSSVAHLNSCSPPHAVSLLHTDSALGTWVKQ